MPGKTRFALPISLTAVAAGVLAASLAIAAVMTDRVADRPAPGIERAEADHLLSQAVRLAQAGDFAGLCQAVAAAQGPCRALLDYTKSQGWRPGTSTPVVINERRYPGSDHGKQTLVLHLAGTRSDGSHYEADFPVIRDHVGQVKGMAPVYWSGMTFDGSQLRCVQGSNEACVRDQAPPPPTEPKFD